jgi:hypothetical protein
LSVVVHLADIQDRDGAFYLLGRARRLFPFIKCIFADGGYAGEKMALVVWRRFSPAGSSVRQLSSVRSLG